MADTSAAGLGPAGDTEALHRGGKKAAARPIPKLLSTTIGSTTMNWYRSVRILALGAVVLCALALGGAKAASVWFALNPDEIVCDATDTRTCAIGIAWSVSNEHRFDKWKICWKPKDSSTWLDDHCSYNARLVDIEDNFYAIPGLEIGGYYRVKLEGRRERNGKWTCVHKSMIRAVGYAARLGNGGICTDF